MCILDGLAEALLLVKVSGRVTGGYLACKRPDLGNMSSSSPAIAAASTESQSSDLLAAGLDKLDPLHPEHGVVLIKLNF